MQYTVQAQRADLRGPVSPIFTVHFGRQPGGARKAVVGLVSAAVGGNGERRTHARRELVGAGVEG